MDENQFYFQEKPNTTLVEKKFENQLEILRKLVCNEKESHTLTKEDILDRAIQALSSSLFAKDQNYLIKPQVNYFPYQTEDLENAFRYILVKQLSFGLNFNEYRTVDDVNAALCTLKDLAEQMDKVEYRLHVTMIEYGVQSLFSYNLKTSMSLLEQAMSLYAEARAYKRNTSTLFRDFDSLPRIYLDKAFAYFMKGDFKKATEFWKKGRDLITDPSLNRISFLVLYCIFKGFLGAPFSLDESSALLEFYTTIGPAGLLFRPIIECIVGVVLIREGLKSEGFLLLNKTMKTISERIGNATELFFSCSMASGYLEAEMFDEGLQYIDYIWKKNMSLRLMHTGMWNIPSFECSACWELFRVKACILFAKLRKIESTLTIEEINFKVLEIRQVLNEGLQSVAGRDCLLFELKLTIVLGELFLRYGTFQERGDILFNLQNYMSKIVVDDYLCSGETDISKANILIQKLIQSLSFVQDILS